MSATKAQKVSELLEQLDNLTYIAEYNKSFRIGQFVVSEGRTGLWTATNERQSRTFSTRMAAISWAKFVTEGKAKQAETIIQLSEELDGATTHVKQLINASRNHPQVVGKIDPANDKRISKVEKLADYILKNS